MYFYHTSINLASLIFCLIIVLLTCNLSYIQTSNLLNIYKEQSEQNRFVINENRNNMHWSDDRIEIPKIENGQQQTELHGENFKISSSEFNFTNLARPYLNLTLLFDGTASNVWILARYFNLKNNAFTNDVYLSRNGRNNLKLYKSQVDEMFIFENQNVIDSGLISINLDI